jgi:hypothetical protein
LPKAIAAGFADSVVVAVTLDPLTAMVAGMLDALVVRLTLPFKVPADCGANCTLRVLL